MQVDEFDGQLGTADVVVGEQRYAIAEHWHAAATSASPARCNGQPFTAQIERGTPEPAGYRVAHNGTQIEALVLSPRAAELLQLMPFKAPPDMSKFLLSPMPGLLVDVAVQPGQKVQAGERLAVIEAMKMENILIATQDGVVARGAGRTRARAWRWTSRSSRFA